MEGLGGWLPMTSPDEHAVEAQQMFAGGIVRLLGVEHRFGGNAASGKLLEDTMESRTFGRRRAFSRITAPEEPDAGEVRRSIPCRHRGASRR
jgi:hypothetical protein